jgi:hypothetical protein
MAQFILSGRPVGQPKGMVPLPPVGEDLESEDSAQNLTHTTGLGPGSDTDQQVQADPPAIPLSAEFPSESNFLLPVDQFPAPYFQIPCSGVLNSLLRLTGIRLENPGIPRLRAPIRAPACAQKNGISLLISRKQGISAKNGVPVAMHSIVAGVSAGA